MISDLLTELTKISYPIATVVPRLHDFSPAKKSVTLKDDGVEGVAGGRRRCLRNWRTFTWKTEAVV